MATGGGERPAVHATRPGTCFPDECQVLMMRRPAGRFFTMPFPPLPLAARIFAAFILPPRLFFAMLLDSEEGISRGA